MTRLVYPENEIIDIQIFDDTLIRSVDRVVTSFLHRTNEPNYIGKYDALLEYRSLFLSLPRQCGKSQYLAKLSTILKDAWVFHPTVAVKESATQRYSYWNSIQHFVPFKTLPNNLRGIPYVQWPRYMIFDECTLEEVRMTVLAMQEYGYSAKKITLIALNTPR